MKNLIKISYYVLENHGIKDPIFYAKFITQPLELCMFVPCDEDGNVLEEPKDFENLLFHIEIKLFDGTKEVVEEVLQYQQAKAKILFEGFEVLSIECVCNSNLYIHFLNDKVKIEEHFEEIITKLPKQVETIEDLIPYNLELTDNTL